MIGQTISHYQITARLGAGGMGEVYLAEDTNLKRKVALKFLPDHFSKDADVRARFQREAEALAALNHPNIVTVFDVAEHEGRPYIAMEYLEGRSLKELIASGDLDTDRVLNIVSQIAEGLAAAHEEKIVHRDIKSDNVIVTARGRVKIMDFGLATWRGVTQLTREGSTVGTMAYMSPQQAQGKPVDHRGDLWSLGVILYELLTRHLPFAGDHEAAISYAIINETPEPLARYKSGIPDDLQRIVNKALDKDPETRYQTAHDILADLRQLRKTAASSVSVAASPAAPPPPSRKRRTAVISAASVAVMLLFLLVFRPWRIVVQPTQQAEAGRTMLAVLPFENLGSEDQDYFADGMTEEITSRLAGIGGLGVISRTSVLQYKNTTKTIPEIGSELGVDYILEGTVRWDRSGDVDRVRITPQLIRVADDTHVWTDRFNRQLDDIFAVQAQIAEQVALALNIALLPDAREEMESRPTANMLAYDYFLRGREYYDSDGSPLRAIPMFEEAIELDSLFAGAHAMLAQLHGYVYLNDIDSSPERLDAAREAAESALRLDPGGAEGHMAMGYFHYYGSRDYGTALEHFERALRLRPNNSDLLAATAYVQRRQGRWHEAETRLAKAVNLDPRSVVKVNALALTYLYMHRLDDIHRVVDNLLRFAPDDPLMLFWKTIGHLYRGDDAATVREALGKVDQYAERSFFAYWAEVVDISLRDYGSALRRRSSPGNYESADTVEFLLRRADIHRYMGDDEQAKRFSDLSREICQDRVSSQPDIASHHMNLALAYAGLGNVGDAIREAERAIELLPVSEDALSGSGLLGSYAEVHVLLGQHGEAIAMLEHLLNIPSRTQIAELHFHPRWDPLRDDPRFQALLEKYAETPP